MRINFSPSASVWHGHAVGRNSALVAWALKTKSARMRQRLRHRLRKTTGLAGLHAKGCLAGLHAKGKQQPRRMPHTQSHLTGLGTSLP